MGIGRPILWGYGTVLGVTALAVVCALATSRMLAMSMPPFAVFALSIALLIAITRPLLLVFQRHPAPLRQLRADVIANWPWVFGIGVMLLALPLHLDATTRIKQAIPDIQPFYADPFLIELDRVLFFGRDAWEVTHAFFGETATRAIDFAYAGWLFVQVVLTVYLVLAKDAWMKIRVALSLQLAWLLMGAAMAVSLASVGPCFVSEFYSSDHYAPLMERVRGYDGLLALNAMSYLLSVQGQSAVGGGISAMPSLHVGIAVLILLAVREYWPKWQSLGWAYVAVMYVGSIHLGWHYATDGIVSAAGMVAIWWATGRYCRWLQLRQQTVSGS